MKQFGGSLVVCDVNSPREFVTTLSGDFPKVFPFFVVCVDMKAHSLAGA